MVPSCGLRSSLRKPGAWPSPGPRFCASERTLASGKTTPLPLLQRRQFQRLRRTEPDHVVGVVLERVAGLRVGEDREGAAVEHQPRHDLGELLDTDSELATAAGMRADRIVVHAPNLDAERFAGGFAELKRGRPR